MNAGRRRLAAWAGMIGPALFVTTFTVEGWLRPGYHPASMFVSALSLGSRGWVQIVNFVVLGALLFAFARGVETRLGDGRSARAGPILLTIIAGSIFVSGPFVMDPAGTPPAQMSLHGALHQGFGAVVFSLMPVSCFVFWRRFRADPEWRSFQSWTLAAGIVIVAAVLGLKIAQRPPIDELHALGEWVGLFQRAALITYMIWIFAFALGLHRRNPPAGTTPAPG
jgi:Protein of unknown function (DUF998)